jgi:hypothetical protein
MKLEEIKNKTNEAVSYLVAALESGESDVLTQYLNAMARFHNYSFGNIMLIARQKPQATNVAGIRTWNSLGRFVKRGEKGIMILAPLPGVTPGLCGFESCRSCCVMPTARSRWTSTLRPFRRPNGRRRAALRA